ncbi:MAG: arsenic transporter [Bacteroidota bacterium]|nr:arsenic transporter [Bacteroidota bacterium]
MPHLTIWIIAFLSTTGIIIRPFGLPEATWAVAGATLLVLSRVMLPSEALTGVARGLDVYLFLTGMMLLSETAREEKLFDWLASHATRLANGSANKLFLLIYLVGVLVTTFLSNDATAVVLTPAVAAAVRAAKAEKPLPFLFICAFIANAASFVLPISNPANLVIYGSNMPPLLQWLPRYILPSLLSIIATFFILGFTQRKALRQKIISNMPAAKLSKGGKMAGVGIIITGITLIGASAEDIQLGVPTAIAGVLTSLIVIVLAGKKPWTIIKGISWSVLPLVAGLFVIVEALNKTGLIKTLSGILSLHATRSVVATTWGSGVIAAFGCNLINNLPAGLISGNAVHAAHVPEIVKSAVLIGIDLGPNLSITGSLATILWLVALRRENLSVDFRTFITLGFFVMTPALMLALAALWL